MKWSGTLGLASTKDRLTALRRQQAVARYVAMSDSEGDVCVCVCVCVYSLFAQYMPTSSFPNCIHLYVPFNLMWNVLKSVLISLIWEPTCSIIRSGTSYMYLQELWSLL